MKKHIMYQALLAIIIVVLGQAQTYQFTVQSFTWSSVMQYHSALFGGDLVGGAYCVNRNNPVGRLSGGSGNPDYSQERYRTLVFCTIDDVDIPNNATIQSATMSVTFDNFPEGVSQSVKLVDINAGATWGRSSTELWNDAGLGTTYKSEIPSNVYTQSQYSFVRTNQPDLPFLNGIQNSLSSNYFNLAFVSEQEGTNGKISNVSSFSLTISYTLPAPTFLSLSFLNNFTGGTMGIVGPGISNPTQPVPYTKSDVQIGSPFAVTANEQTDGQGNSRVWANSVPNQPSIWLKNNSPATGLNPYSFTANVNASYEAGLRRRYDISRNDQTDYDGTQSNAQTFQIVELNSGTVSAPSSKTVNGKNYLFYQWSDGVTTNERVVSNPTGNQTLTALYKAHFLSSLNSDFETAGSHKFIRTGDGTLHLVYSSYLDGIGYKVFYETSSNNGTTWQMRYSSNGVNPAIAAINNNRVVIVYPVAYNIKAVCYDISQNAILSNADALATDPWNSPSDVNLAITSAGKIMLTWFNTSVHAYSEEGYYGRYGSINASGTISWLSTINYEDALGRIAGAGARRAALDVRLHTGNGLFHFAFDDSDGFGRQINYGPIYFNGNYVSHYVYSPYNNCLSSSSRFENNTNPSFIAVNNSEATRFNWLGEFEGEVMSVFKDPGYFRYWNFGYGVTSTSINKATDGYVIGWSNGFDHSYTNSSALYELGSISSTGSYIQVGNSDYLSNMKAMGFNTASLPYVFNLSSPIGSMQKTDVQANLVALGRSGVISIQTKNSEGTKRDSTKIMSATKSFIQFAFTIDNVTVDGQSIKFIEIPETVKPEDATSLNIFLTTEPFAINDNSSLTYDVTFSTTHSDKASEVLKQNRYVNFKVELIDAKTQQVLGILNIRSGLKNTSA